MVRIAISVEAFEAIARTLPLGSVGYERGKRYVWLEWIGEAIILNSAWEMINGMVNWGMFVVHDSFKRRY